MTTTKSLEAAGVLAGQVQEILETLAQIQRASEDHFGVDPERAHFGHVGDACRILDGLREVRRIACRESE